MLFHYPLTAQTNPTNPPAQPGIERVTTSITVVGRIATEAPAAISVLERKDIERTPGVNLDDHLRMVPGFSLFRRSSSLVANPTTQGVSLRGLGSTGASRTLVLWDGVPLNDPFGGWVYWTRVSPDQLERVEISRGASTSIFGDRAMAGAITLFSREPERYRLHGSYEGGNRNAHSLTSGISHVWRRLAASGNVRAFTSDGYFIVPKGRRGSADRAANVRLVAADTRLDYIGDAGRLFLKFDVLAEERHNGTVLQRNSTGLGTLAANFSWEKEHDGISVLGYHTREKYIATFSSTSLDRNIERLTSLQTVPSEDLGAAAFWRHGNGNWNSLIGADADRVHGVSTDVFVSPSAVRAGGGTLLAHGVFGQFNFAAGPFKVFLGARHHFTGSDRTFFSPSAGVVAGRKRFRARASVYRSFRSPTLNELFREFRVGNAVTQANAGLRPETLFGAEAGVDVIAESARLSLTVFRNSLQDLITNVTLRTSPAEIIRQRQNAASALTRGVELDLRKNWRHWQGELGYLFSDARFSTRQRIPQTPKSQGSAQWSYLYKGTTASVGVRSYAAQFEDDRNQFVLPGFASVQLVVRQRLANNLTATVAIENMLDRQYLTGFSPTPTIGSPRLWRAGLRWDGHFH